MIRGQSLGGGEGGACKIITQRFYIGVVPSTVGNRVESFDFSWTFFTVETAPAGALIGNGSQGHTPKYGYGIRTPYSFRTQIRIM